MLCGSLWAKCLSIMSGFGSCQHKTWCHMWRHGLTLNALNASWPQWHQKHTAFEDRFTLPFLITWTFMYQMGNSTYTHISNVKSTLVSIHDVQHMYTYIYIYNMPASFGYAHTRTYIPIFCLILARKEVPIISWYMAVCQNLVPPPGEHQNSW